jgi:hypothetical protein
MVMIAVVCGWVFADQCIAGDAQIDQVNGMAADIAADPIASTLEFGPEWQKVADGVWEMIDEDGIVNRRIFGLSGVQWKLAQERKALVDLLDKHAVVTAGQEETAQYRLERIRELESIESDMLANAKATWEYDDGYMCGSDWDIFAQCNYIPSPYSAGSFGDAGFTNSPTCTVTASTNSHSYSQLKPTGVHDTDSDYSGPNGGGGGCLSSTTIQYSQWGTWFSTEAYAAVRYFNGSTWIGFYSVECEYDNP